MMDHQRQQQGLLSVQEAEPDGERLSQVDGEARGSDRRNVSSHASDGSSQSESGSSTSGSSGSESDSEETASEEGESRLQHYSHHRHPPHAFPMGRRRANNHDDDDADDDFTYLTENERLLPGSGANVHSLQTKTLRKKRKKKSKQKKSLWRAPRVVLINPERKEKMKSKWADVCQSRMVEVIIWTLLVLAVVVVVIALSLDARTPQSDFMRACTVYCEGPILDAVSNSNVFNDSKTFVDMPMKKDPHDIMKAFKALPDHSKETIAGFLDDNFNQAGTDQETWVPDDFPPQPPFAQNVKNATMKAFTISVHNIWRQLGRKTIPDVDAHQERYSIMALPHPYIVPGGRFREVYYWDTYWIIKGLLQSGLVDTVRGILKNYYHLINENGFIPNGNRVYYLTRSQPPLLNEMVMALYETTQNKTDLETALPLLLKEYDYWNSTEAKRVNDLHYPYLTRYSADTELPRPESYREDVHVAETSGMDADQQKVFYHNMATGAETGWDFSSRWFANGFDLNTIETSDIVPVDLNVFMMRFEMHLASIINIVDSDSQKAQQFSDAMTSRGAAMVALMFNITTCSFHDYHIPTTHQINRASAANYFPLWASNVFQEGIRECMVTSLKSSGLVREAGVDTTSKHTGQQWDAPNGWAPVQWILASGLTTHASPIARELADTIMCRWLETNVQAFKKNGFMYEKYDVTKMGHGGGGGEYTPQLGFGWTNGVALDFMAQLAPDYDLRCIGNKKGR